MRVSSVRFSTVLAFLLALLSFQAEGARASQVSVRGATILLDGHPFVPNGASVTGTARLAELKALGGTVVRTYGDDPGEMLDAAQRAGLKVIAGFWMGHPRLGFDYTKRAAVDAQLEALRHMVERYRSHPALLMWSLGNEVEIETDSASVRLAFAAVGEAAQLVKGLDSQHPTMAVVAEVGGNKVEELMRLAPAIDVLGINGYGDGLLTSAKRARVQGWTGPIVLTEMGPLGHWDAPRSPWGARVEPTSTEKAARMRRYLSTARQMGVGAMAFLWGQKQEVTPTWYSLLLPTGEWTETVEVMGDLWGGKPPGAPNRAPRILSFHLERTVSAPTGRDLNVTLVATDPDGDPVKVEWVVMAETTAKSVGGDPEAVPEAFAGAVRGASETGARISGLGPGHYRIFAYVRDGRGAAATANLPFEVR